MVSLNVNSCAVLELFVVLFQVVGVAGLGLTRLAHSPSWSNRGRITFVIALIGLGLTGALCGRHDSEFALFAGGTMTILLIGMTAGSGASEISLSSPSLVNVDGHLAA